MAKPTVKDWAKGSTPDRGVPRGAASDHDASFELAKKASSARQAGDFALASKLYEEAARHPGTSNAEASSYRNMAAKMKAAK